MTIPRPLRAILFDLGGTLMYSRQPWEPILQQGYEALARSLCENGLDLDCASLPDAIRYHLDRYFARREQDLVETTYFVVLKNLLAENGHKDVEPIIIRNALDAFYRHTQANWHLEEDALLMLRTLEAGGYRLGIVSNAGDSQDVFQLVERFEIGPFFDFVLTSADCSFRKPHPHIFELALAHWNLSPPEAAMVGDSLDADIRGAQQLGMTGIWITRRASRPRPAEGANVDGAAPRPTSSARRRFSIQPDASIRSLRALPMLLSRIAS
jgi:HAD superfamily hydrolase (TIGR01662 family)